ncbi:MAG: GNAT family N-acetyltransferase [Actinomycetota bacterium]|nr:GNAT family N-acetyltransferase [Actinomycetota bacterium]
MQIRAADRLEDLVALQQLASRPWPSGGHHPGGLGWALAIDEAPAGLLVAVADGELVGWSGWEDDTVEVHVRGDQPTLAAELLGAELGEMSAPPAGVLVFEGDRAMAQLAEARGFRPDLARRPVHGMFHDAVAEVPSAPAGYRIRGLAAGEEPARVEAHRAAWRPATLPYPTGTRPVIPPDATSRFAHEYFRAVQRAWLYDPALDLVVEATDGALVGCCTVWWDPALRVAEVEPLGVVPEHRRRGLATALCMTAAAMVGLRGGHQVFINTGPREDYPVPALTYAAAGFSAVRRATVWTKPTEGGTAPRT